MLKKDRKNDGLDSTCENYIGKHLKVKPIHGWGWDGNDEAPVAPAPFKILLKNLWWHDGIRRGGIGVIEEMGHRYDGHKAIFDLRHYGDFNFSDKLGHYNIIITKSDIVENDGWPSPKNNQIDCGGYAEIKAI